MKVNKRGQLTFAAFGTIVLLLVISFITMTVGAQTQLTLADQQCGNLTSSGQCEPNGQTQAFNATFNTMQTYQNFSNLMPVIGVIIAAGLILGLLALFGR